MPVQEKVDEILHELPTLESERSVYESDWREVDDRVNPINSSAWRGTTPNVYRGVDIFDHTAALGLDRFTAAIMGMLMPRGQRWHGVVTTDGELNKLQSVQLWCEHAADRLFAMRYAPDAGFETAAIEAVRSLGTYGSAPFMTGLWEGHGLYYKQYHMSEILVKEDFRGRIDSPWRKYRLTARQAAQEFGAENLTPKVAAAFGDPKKREQMFDFLTVIRPRADRDPERLDFRRLRFESLNISLDDKALVREGGFGTLPIAFSRYVTGPGEKYGRSPAMQVLGSIRTVNEIVRTMLRAGHKAVDPPLLAPEDGVLSQIQTMPGGINVGGLDFAGRPAVVPMQTGGNLAIGMELLNNEREPIRDAFLEKVFSLVMERRDRMTATEVLEITRLQGILATPTAGRQETEWLGLMIERELAIGLATGQIAPPPREVMEAGAGVRIVYDNPLNRAALAEEAIGFSRWIEMLQPLAAIDPSVFDVVDTEQAPRNLATALAVRPSYLAAPDAVAAKRKAREDSQAGAEALAALPAAAGAAKDLASARAQESANI